jgi:hypothetical protein
MQGFNRGGRDKDGPAQGQFGGKKMIHVGMGYKEMADFGEVYAAVKVMDITVRGEVEQDLPVNNSLASGAYIFAFEPVRFGTDFAGTKNRRYAFGRAGSKIFKPHGLILSCPLKTANTSDSGDGFYLVSVPKTRTFGS